MTEQVTGFLVSRVTVKRFKQITKEDKGRMGEFTVFAVMARGFDLYLIRQ